jgi:hypothetical protein
MGLSTAVDVAGGGDRSCAVLADGSVWCWGRIGSTSTTVTVPTRVDGIATATRVVAGGTFACALLADQTVTCWGSGASGQLGTAGITESLVPLAVPDLAGVTALAALSDGVCALRSDHTVVCWGASNQGQRGHPLPAPGPGRTPVTGISTAVAIGAGNNHACAILEDGEVRCWGLNSIGQVGDGTVVLRQTPVTVPGLTAVAIDGGNRHTCAITPSGDVRCWGADSLGQLGLGVRPYAPVAVPVDTRGIPALEIVLEAPVAINTLVVPISIAVRAGSPPALTFRVSSSPNEPPSATGWPTTPPVTRSISPQCGTCTIYAWAHNDTGEMSRVATATVIVDAVRPVASITAPAFTTAQSVAVSSGGTDAGSGIGAWLIAETPVNPAPNDTRWREVAPATFTLSKGDGLKRVFLWTRDLAWNVSAASEADVRLDTAAPTGLGVPGRPTLYTGRAKGTIPARIAWTAARDLGTVTYEVAWQANGSTAWHGVTLANPGSSSAIIALPAGTFRVRVRASDALGHAGSWRTGSWFTLRRLEESASAIRLVKGFRRVTASGASGGRLATATRAGSTISAKVSATSIAWVGVRGPDRGRARVYLDGRLVATVDLYAPTRSDAVIVWRRSFSKAATHVLRIVATGTHARGSSASRVDVDALLLAR